MTGRHVAVSELSPLVRRALDSVGYGAADIAVEPALSVDGSVAGGNGMRGFVVVVNVATGRFERVSGSWGGPNPWSRSPVDAPAAPLELPETGLVIKGTRGHPRTFARIYAHPTLFGNLLGSGEPAEELSDTEQQAIYCFAAIKGGEYRRDELSRRGVSPATVDGLVARGFLKRNRAGATQITTKGKNARTVRS